MGVGSGEGEREKENEKGREEEEASELAEEWEGGREGGREGLSLSLSVSHARKRARSRTRARTHTQVSKRSAGQERASSLPRPRPPVPPSAASETGKVLARAPRMCIRVVLVRAGASRDGRGIEKAAAGRVGEGDTAG